ncbi:MAG: DUF4232 domain-containing protein [Nocardioidaceae bacterium]
MNIRVRRLLRVAAVAVAAGTAAGTMAMPVASAAPVAASSMSSVGRCTIAHLRIRLGSASGAAGTEYRNIRFTNTGTRTCALLGYPGVSFRTAGHQVGFAARRSGMSYRSIMISPGGHAVAAYGIPNPGNFPRARCHAARATAVRIYAPGAYRSVRLPDRVRLCTTRFGRPVVEPVARRY